MKKSIILISLAALGLLAAACTTEGDKFDPNKEIVLVTGTENTPVVKVDADSYSFTVSATGLAKEEAKVYLSYDASLIDAYNAKNRTAYVPVPADAVSLDKNFVTIAKDAAASDAVTVTITNRDFVEEGYVYVIPVGITKVEGGSFSVLEGANFIFIRPTNEYKFMAYDVNNSSVSSVFRFPQKADLSTWTYEIKVYPYQLGRAGTIARVCAWGNGSSDCMLRFNESGYADRALQAAVFGTNIVSKKQFDPEKWYLISMVYDGANLAMYIDGELDSQTPGDKAMEFSQFELGMTWGGYNVSQLFHGRISEVRVWGRALSVNEMKEGICSVPVNSEKLIGYWRFNDGSGHIFKDSTGNGWDMDWSNVWHNPSENADVQYDNSAVAEGSGRWVSDDLNLCRN